MNPNDPMFQTLTLALPMIAIFYFLLWRPQSQRQKQLRQMVDGLRRGDTVVTAGGILGKVAKPASAEDQEILIEMFRKAGMNVKFNNAPIAEASASFFGPEKRNSGLLAAWTPLRGTKP